jgi:3'-5' exoribonuclease
VKKIFVEQIRERDWVESPFLVRDKIMAMAKNGKPYMTLKLIDRSGEVEGRVWDRVDEWNELFGRDDFLLVKGKASVYMGKMQIIIQELERLPENAVELADFLPVAPRDPAEMLAELRARVAALQDPHLRALLEAFLADPEFLQRYTTAPAAKAMHHVYIGGLLEHSLAVAALAEDVCRHYPGLNHDLLVTGALLHDVGKVAELSYLRSFDYTDDGKLLGHIVIGVEMIEERLRRLPDFPRPLATLLKHLLLSHHGQYEYGSPKRPKTLEAVILNFIDDLDSKINGVRTHIEREPDSDSSWTSYHRLYDRYFYKGKDGSPQRPLAPAAPEAPPAPPAAAERPDSRPQQRPAAANRQRRFGTTLGEQLKGKSLDLFAVEDEGKE